MEPDPSITDSPGRDPKGSASPGIPRGTLAACLACAAVVAWFYFFVAAPGAGGDLSTLSWLKTTWNKETDYEHGFLVPVIMIGLIAFQWKTLRQNAGPGVWYGLPLVILGCLFFVAAQRAGQPRLAVGGLPMILWGSSLFLWGWKTSRLLFFPLFFLWLAVPVPEFQQATTRLQILSTHLAKWGSELFGIQVLVQGTEISSVGDKWAKLSIDEGCGGIRSLMALIMIASVWAYLAPIALWKKALLCLAAFPLAIFGNMLRLTSIFVISEYGDPYFARHTWHDWSGLLLFYPISLMLLLGVHSVLEGGLPWKRQKKIAVRTIVRKQVEVN
jgi:exosortase